MQREQPQKEILMKSIEGALWLLVPELSDIFVWTFCKAALNTSCSWKSSL